MKYIAIILKTTNDVKLDKVRHDAVMSEQFQHWESANSWISNEKKNIEKRNRVLGPRITTSINDSTIIAVDETASNKNYYEMLAILLINYRK